MDNSFNTDVILTKYYQSTFCRYNVFLKVGAGPVNTFKYYLSFKYVIPKVPYVSLLLPSFCVLVLVSRAATHSLQIHVYDFMLYDHAL
jgi:hypothetical protein